MSARPRACASPYARAMRTLTTWDKVMLAVDIGGTVAMVAFAAVVGFELWVLLLLAATGTVFFAIRTRRRLRRRAPG